MFGVSGVFEVLVFTIGGVLVLLWCLWCVVLESVLLSFLFVSFVVVSLVMRLGMSVFFYWWCFGVFVVSVVCCSGVCRCCFSGDGAGHVHPLQKTWFISTHLFQGFIKNPRNKPVKRC